MAKYHWNLRILESNAQIQKAEIFGSSQIPKNWNLVTKFQEFSQSRMGLRLILDWNLVTKFQALNSSGIQAFRFQSFLDW